MVVYSSFMQTLKGLGLKLCEVPNREKDISKRLTKRKEPKRENSINGVFFLII